MLGRGIHLGFAQIKALMTCRSGRRVATRPGSGGDRRVEVLGASEVAQVRNLVRRRAPEKVGRVQQRLLMVA